VPDKVFEKQSNIVNTKLILFILADRTYYGRAYAAVLRLSVVCRRLYGMYCG